MRKASVMAAIFILSASGFGCANDEAEKIKKIERENKILRVYKENVEATDRSGTEEGNGCTKNEVLLLRTHQGCSWESYNTGFKNDSKDNGLEMSERDMAIWGLVAELNNRYANISGTKKYGDARFYAMAGGVTNREFRSRVEPSMAMNFIRNYMSISQEDFTDIIARTTAGESTPLAKKKEGAKNETIKKEKNNKITAEERRIFCETGGILPTRGVKTKEEMEKMMGCKTPVKKVGEAELKQPITSTKKKWTYDQAIKEACDAGRQYREDVDLNGMKPSQARYEAQQYSKYLAENSPAPQKALYDKINQGIWMDSCF